MENDFKKELEKYGYYLPKALIAKEPASPRDRANLLVYQKNTDKIFYDRFSNIAKYLPKKSVLVFNQTKVLPARLVLRKETGGMVKVLYLGQKNNCLEVLADRKINVGTKLSLNSKIYFKVNGQNTNSYLLKPSFPIARIYQILQKFGQTPIPPYIKNSPLSERELKEKYQAVFAKNLGSVAAPTASLHFTKNLLTKLKKSGISIKFITLHINLGTFAPLKEENLKTRRLHEEYYEIDRKTANFLANAKKQDRPIIAVGTTVVRTLESASGRNKTGKTDLFIKEGYKFKFVDAIITNFHVPKSSLLMLVSAFTDREKLLEIYQKAIAKKFKFYSFGDGMLIY